LCGAGALARVTAYLSTLPPRECSSINVHPSQTRRSKAVEVLAVPIRVLTPKYQYRRRLPHFQSDAPLFVTFCAGGPLVLSEEARDLVLEHILREHGKRIDLLALVVMPDHVHLLLTALRDENGWPVQLFEIMQCLKSCTAHRINKPLHRSGPVWEEESFDHVLRSDESLKEKCEYIRQNPVRAGLVQEPEDYRWLWVNPTFK
jgi:putative transposase